MQDWYPNANDLDRHDFYNALRNQVRKIKENPGYVDFKYNPRFDRSQKPLNLKLIYDVGDFFLIDMDHPEKKGNTTSYPGWLVNPRSKTPEPLMDYERLAKETLARMRLNPHYVRQRVKSVTYEISKKGRKYAHDIIEKNLFGIIKSQPDPEAKPEFFYIDYEDQLGKGGNGAVYACYPIDPETITRNENKKLAIKELKYNDVDEGEVDILSKFYKTLPTIDCYDRTSAIITEYLPGKSLQNLGKQIKPLSFSERIHLATQLMMSFNLIHHDTVKMGDAFSHTDIKPENLLIDIQKHPQDNTRHITEPYVIDFGNSEFVRESEEKNVEWLTTVFIAPPEIMDKKVGVKSDIYMLAPIVMMLLGVKDPYKEKLDKYYQLTANKKNKGKDYYFFYKELLKIGFNRRNMFDGLQIPGDSKLVKTQINLFLDRMLQDNYDARPSPDDTLRFFVSLRNYCLHQEQKNADDSFGKSDLVKTILIANNLWDTQFSIAKKILLLKDYRLEHDDILCDKIINLAKNEQLTETTLQNTITQHGIENLSGLANLTFNELKEKLLTQNSSSFFKKPPDQQSPIEVALRDGTIKSMEDVATYFEKNPNDKRSSKLVNEKLIEKRLDSLSTTPRRQ